MDCLASEPQGSLSFPFYSGKVGLEGGHIEDMEIVKEPVNVTVSIILNICNIFFSVNAFTPIFPTPITIMTTPSPSHNIIVTTNPNFTVFITINILTTATTIAIISTITTTIVVIIATNTVFPIIILCPWLMN
ncbi:hypothetical protein H671_1g0994 [Cricetulus griseus]|nr:hypothetical protein H671_1g0994 [Cricetulus griseus]